MNFTPIVFRSIALLILCSNISCLAVIGSLRCNLSKSLSKICLGGALFFSPVLSQVHAATDATSISNIKVSYDGELVPIGKYLGEKATLVVDIGSQCDLPSDGDPQCKSLVQLYNKHKGEGFQVLAFPTDQFRDKSMLGESEPIEEVRKDLKKNYGFDFPIFDFVEVNGLNTAEVYKVMKEIKSINPSDLKKINWNFEKFLLDKDGVPVRRYRPNFLPPQLEDDVNTLIQKGSLKPRSKAALGAV